MEITPWTATRTPAIDLARADAFCLGPLTVDPSIRRISRDGRSETVEPRVMRVLIALGEKPGRVLSRDELIELCWDGHIVTDNAVTRVISLLRHALDNLSRGAVRLETITKVGFRLVVDGLAAGAEPSVSPRSGEAKPVAAVRGVDFPVWRRTWTRRATAVGLVLASGGAAIGFAGWLLTRKYVPDPRAVEFYRRGQAIQKAGVVESMGEAIEAYKQAVAIDPRYADAWASIAIGYRYPVLRQSLPLGDLEAVRSAAQRALALDPDNADARLAVIVLYPLFRRWLEQEASLRAFIGDHPDSALGNTFLGLLLLDVGRCEEAIVHARRVTEIDPTRQIGWATLARAFNYAGRNNDAAVALEEGRSRWPQDRRFWMLHYVILMESKRHAEAAAFVRDTTRRPRTVPPEAAKTMAGTADALATGRGIAEIAAKVRQGSASWPASFKIESLGILVTQLTQLGMTDEAFRLLEFYFFGGIADGKHFPPPGLLDPRPSFQLFVPGVIGLRGDPRHASLLERTGLEDYWRKSGTQPDFRRS